MITFFILLGIVLEACGGFLLAVEAIGEDLVEQWRSRFYSLFKELADRFERSGELLTFPPILALLGTNGGIVGLNAYLKYPEFAAKVRWPLMLSILNGVSAAFVADLFFATLLIAVALTFSLTNDKRPQSLRERGKVGAFSFVAGVAIQLGAVAIPAIVGASF